MDDMQQLFYNASYTHLLGRRNFTSKTIAASQALENSLAIHGRLYSLFRKHYKHSAGFGIVIVLYLAATLLVPLNSVALRLYHLSHSDGMVLTFSIALFSVAIWVIALLGYLRLKDYAGTIKSSRDGQAFKLISAGLFWLTLWLPVSGIASVTQRYALQSHPSLVPVTVIANNYSSLLITLVAMVLIYRGTQQLLAIAHVLERVVWEGIIAYAAFAGFYTFLVIQSPSRQFPVPPATTADFYTPDWLTLMTLVVPRLLIWFLGFQAALNLYRYRKNVKGKIYQQSLAALSHGLALITATVAVLRTLQTLSSSLSRWHITAILLLIYALLILIAIGYILITRGARNLMRIEHI